MTETPNQSTSLIEGFRRLWPELAVGQRVVLLSSLVAIISPFFSWFHRCVITPGQYQCESWNGFQNDNDIFGLFVFLIGATILFSILWPLIIERWQLFLSPGELQLIFGIFLVLLALIRLITFAGNSTLAITISPGVGQLFVFLAGLGIVIGNQFPAILAIQENWNKLPDTPVTSRDHQPQQSEQPAVEDEDEDEASELDNELQSLLDYDRDDDRQKP